MFLVISGLENNFEDSAALHCYKSYKLLKYPKAENSVILFFLCTVTHTEQPRREKVYMTHMSRFESQDAL